MNTNIGKSLPKLNGFAKVALALGVILSLALAQLASASGQAAQTSTSRPSGVLTFSNQTNFFDYNITNGELTDYGKGKNAYRAKNGYALVGDSDHNLILVSPNGKSRGAVVTAKNFSVTMPGFILSPDGKIAVYDRMSDDPRFKHVLVVHNVHTGSETQQGFPDFDWPVPQDWTFEGSLLLSPFSEQKAVSDKGESVFLNFAIIDKSFVYGNIHGVAESIDQPGTKPVGQIDDPRMDPSPSGKRIAFSWDGHVWIANTDGSGAKQITKSEGIQVGEDEPAWSPDGRWLAIHHFDGLSSDIYLVPVDGVTHSIGDKTVKRLVDKNGLSSDVKGSGLRCAGRITWR